MHAADEVVNVEDVLLEVHALLGTEDPEAAAAEDVSPVDFEGRALESVDFVELLRGLLAPLLLVRAWLMPQEMCVRDLAIVCRLLEVGSPLIVCLAALREVLEERLGFSAEYGGRVWGLPLSNAE